MSPRCVGITFKYFGHHTTVFTTHMVWYGHVLRRDDDSVLRVALNLEVTGKRKRGRPKKTWKKQVEEETEKVGLKKEDALRRDKWKNGVREIAEGMG